MNKKTRFIIALTALSATTATILIFAELYNKHISEITGSKVTYPTFHKHKIDNTQKSFEAYHFSDEQLEDLTRVFFSMTNSAKEAAELASLSANKYEAHLLNPSQTKEEGLYNSVKYSWMFPNAHKLMDSDKSHVAQFQKDTIRAVFDGTRILPQGVDFIDSIDDVSSAYTSEGQYIAYDFDKYTSRDTLIKNINNYPYTFYSFMDSDTILGSFYSNKIGDFSYSYEDLLQKTCYFSNLKKLGNLLKKIDLSNSIDSQAIFNCTDTLDSTVKDALLAIDELKQLCENGKLNNKDFLGNSISVKQETNPSEILIKIPNEFTDYIQVSNEDYTKEMYKSYDMAGIKECIINNLLSTLHDNYGIICSIKVGDNSYDFSTGIPKDQLFDDDSVINISFSSDLQLSSNSIQPLLLEIYSNMYGFLNNKNDTSIQQGEKLIILNALLVDTEKNTYRLFNEKNPTNRSYALSGIKADTTQADIGKSENFRKIMASHYKTTSDSETHPHYLPTNNLSPREKHYKEETDINGRGV